MDGGIIKTHHIYQISDGIYHILGIGALREASRLFIASSLSNIMAIGTDVAARLRQPEHTGENRCGPCTVVNVLIAVAIAGVLAVMFPALGIIAFAVFAGVIYLRGYLVPGTPTITGRYVPTRVLQLFGKRPAVEGALEAAEPTEIGSGDASDNEALFAAGVVTRTGDDAVDLAPAFHEEWRERIDAVRERGPGAADVRAMFDAEEVSEHGEGSFVIDGNKSVRWGSNAALVADVAATGIVAERLDEWAEFDADRRQSVLRGLRLCLERCPSCDSPLSVSEERVDPCCQKPHLVAESVCRDCDAAIADAAVVDDGEGESVRTRLLRS